MLKQWMFGIFSLLFAANVLALTEGKDYIQLPQEAQQQAVVQTFLEQDKGKVQVAEFFSYKCPGCYSLEGPFSAWAAKQPQDVAIRRVPVAFNPAWVPLAKTYYVLEELNVVERVNPIIFNAVHKENKRLETQSEIAQYLTTHDVSLNDFNAAYEGFNVNRRWTQAQLLREALQVTSIPAVVINGKYLTHLGMVSPDTFTQVLDDLVKRARGESNL
jgi:protein dithiol oxidoreductase (disulfide-forming)